MRGSTSLDNHEYDAYLADKGRTGELRRRHQERRNANQGYQGWHFGLGEAPVFTRDKAEFKRELDKRGLLTRDDVKRNLK